MTPIHSLTARFTLPPQVWAPAIGAVTTAITWNVLQLVARMSTLHGARAGDASAATSHAVVGYVTALGLAGIFAGLLGGMVGAITSRSGGKLWGVAAGAAGSLLLALSCWMGFLLWQVPQMGESAPLWATPLALSAGLGGWIGSFLRPTEGEGTS